MLFRATVPRKASRRSTRISESKFRPEQQMSVGRLDCILLIHVRRRANIQKIGIERADIVVIDKVLSLYPEHKHAPVEVKH